jgi:hypothetical protein
MSRVLLVNIDSKIPNLALMQISAHHKLLGDTVGFDVENPDYVYVSCIFTKNAEQARGIASLYPNAQVSLGGTGVDINKRLPPEYEKICPDYSIYPEMDYSLGYTTRGCIRKCPFCVVPKKEGRFHRWQHISEFHDKKHKKIIVLDNNVYADKQWFFENTDYVLEHNLAFNAIQGMDIRILDEEIAQRLGKLRWTGDLHFAFDNIRDESKITAGLDLLKNAGINTRKKVIFYVLTGFNSTFDEDIYRVNLLRELNTNVFVMQYKSTPQTRRLANYANRRWLYWKIPFEEYSPKLRHVQEPVLDFENPMSQQAKLI